MFFLRADQKTPGANAIISALALLIVANPKLDVMADTTYTGPPLSYTVYGPGDGCVDDALAFTGATTSVAVLGDATVCEMDELVTPDGTFEVYTKFEGSCGLDSFEVTLYNCMDSMCAECDADPETGELCYLLVGCICCDTTFSNSITQHLLTLYSSFSFLLVFYDVLVIYESANK